MRQTSLRELTTLGIKNAENLAIPSVRNDVSFQNFFLYFCSIKWNYTWHMTFLRIKFFQVQHITQIFVVQAAFLFTVVGTTGFLGILAGQLPGVCIPCTLLCYFVCLFDDLVYDNLFLEIWWSLVVLFASVDIAFMVSHCGCSQAHLYIHSNSKFIWVLWSLHQSASASLRHQIVYFFVIFKSITTWYCRHIA